MRITVQCHVMSTPSIRPVWNIKLMLLSFINLMKWKLGNQLGLFRSSASGLADVRPLAAGQARILRALPQLAAARRKIPPASPEALLPAPMYTLRLAMHMPSAQRMRTQLAGAEVDSGPARIAAMAHGPTAVAGICMCVRRWARAGWPARPPAHTGTSVSREALTFNFAP